MVTAAKLCGLQSFYGGIVAGLFRGLGAARMCGATPERRICDFQRGRSDCGIKIQIA
jgi:hypothetical protein